ncbi:MAG TPA: protein kinase [Ktedonobacteraceae bacterium]|nr:protein kinase [Ktedonobacteraceae bacterium]
MVNRIGQQLGNYRLVRLLGRGGFAEVYLGEHIHLNSFAAVKVLHTEVAASDVASFQQEAHTIARLLHPNIIRVFDYDIANGTPFLIMDYAPNGTLRNAHPKGTRVLLAMIVPYVRQIAAALQYAHDERVIHRDIKPENMLLGRNNVVMLSDFGIATITQSSRHQHTQDIFGTVAYMAPEQIQGKPHPASDQYSLAIVVYEWLTGMYPFHGSFTEIAMQHVVAPPTPLREEIPDIAPEIEQVMLIALAKEPQKRFASVQAFANALEQASASDPSFNAVTMMHSSPPVTSSLPLHPVIVRSSIPPAETDLPPVVETMTTGYHTSPALEGKFAIADSPESITPKQVGSLASIPAADRRKGKLSRRTVLEGLAGLIVIGSGIAAFTITRYISGHAAPPATPLPTKAIATQVPTSTPTPGPTKPPITGSWSSLPSLPSPEADNVAIYVQSQQGNYVYMTGGFHGKYFSPSYDNNLYRYDIAAAQWQIVTSNFPGMINNAVVQDEQKNLFFTAGYSTDTRSVTTLLYMYSPASGSSQPVTPPGGITFGYGGSMIADQRGHLYLTQGFMYGYGSGTSAGNGWYRYDIASNQWHTLAALPQGVGYAVLASDLSGGFVLMGGATDTEQKYGSRAIYRYNIAQDSWAQEQTLAPIAFNGAASCDLGNGQVVVMGGFDTAQQVALNSTWLIDLNTLNARSLTPLPSGSHLGAAAYDGAGTIYLVRGAVNDPNQPTSDFWQLRLNG